MKKGVLHKIGLKKTGGRNNTGRITVRHRGGGHKRAYRATNYQTISENGKIHNHYISGTINNISYDPNRSAYLALCKNDDKVFNLIFGGTNLGAQKGGAHQAHVATRPESYKGLTQHVSKIKDISVGDLVYNLSLLPGKSGQFSRASGTFCKILKQDEKLTVVRLPSYAVKAFNNNNFCILGAVRRPSRLAPLRKAGRNR
jgi:large subunit ribosomal protein L2